MSRSFWHQIFDMYGRETAPAAEEIERVRRGVLASQADTLEAHRLLGALPEPTWTEAERVRGRVRWDQGAERMRFGRRVVTTGVVLAAAAALLVVALPARGVPLQVSIASPDHWTGASAGEAVDLQVRGTGEITGTTKHPEVSWESGDMRVEVEPEERVDLVVETREARVRVVGTVFTVSRSLLGTRVEVERGQVEARCLRTGTDHLLGAGERLLCLPTTPYGLLARARALQDRAAPGEEVLEAAEVGLAQEPEVGAIRSELLLIRIEALVGLGRHDEALDAATAYLEAGFPLRRDEVEDLEAQLEMRVRP